MGFRDVFVGRGGLRVGPMVRLGSGLYVPATAAVGGAPAAPTLTSANYLRGDTLGGGQPIVLTGTWDVGSAVPQIDGVDIAAGQYTVDSATQITFTLPAHLAGAASITVRDAGGTSGALAFTYWDPAQEGDVTLGCEQPDYAPVAGVATWATRVGTAPTSMTANTNPPADGTGEPSFDGSTGIDTNAAANVLLSVAGGTIATIFNPSNADTLADGQPPYARYSMFSKFSSGPIGMYVADNTGGGGTTRGFGAYCYDSVAAIYREARVDPGVSPIGTFRALALTYIQGASLATSVNGSSFASGQVALSGHPLTYPTDNIKLGVTYDNVAGIRGTMRAFWTFSGAKDDAFATKFYAWARQRFGVA